MIVASGNALVLGVEFDWRIEQIPCHDIAIPVDLIQQLLNKLLLKVRPKLAKILVVGFEHAPGLARAAESTRPVLRVAFLKGFDAKSHSMKQLHEFGKKHLDGQVIGSEVSVMLLEPANDRFDIVIPEHSSGKGPGGWRRWSGNSDGWDAVGFEVVEQRFYVLIVRLIVQRDRLDT